VNLGELDELEIPDAQLQIADALLELASPVVGDGGGGVLRVAVRLQRLDS
jgi:hypothetical protein